MNNSDLNTEAKKNNEALEEKNEVKETMVDNASKETKEEKETAKSTETTATDSKNNAAVETKPTTTEEKKEDKKESPTVVAPKVNPLKLEYLDADFIFDVLSVPSVSRHEYRMVTFIMLWARENNVKYEFDEYGNIYLTKGELAEGEEGYPCVTSHMDTVQDGQEAYAQCGVRLPLKERINTKGGHELYVEGMGIGADDKAGVLISLSLFKYFDKIKACFFLEEEVGCQGSKKLNKEWFDDVAYVIGWDSPDRNRAAYACSSELLFGKDFFKEIEQTCKDHGVTDFRSEPFTDVKEIRQRTQVVCMNFGNGGYQAHSHVEYVIMEDIDGACGLGVALIKKLGTKKYRMPSKTCGYGVVSSHDEDINFFAQRNTYNRPTSYTRTYPTSGATTTYNHTSSTTTTPKKDEDTISAKVFEYTVERYETFISDIQKKVEKREVTILDELKKLFEKGDIKFEDVAKVFEDNPSSEPFSTAIEF